MIKFFLCFNIDFITRKALGMTRVSPSSPALSFSHGSSQMRALPLAGVPDEKAEGAAEP